MKNWSWKTWYWIRVAIVAIESAAISALANFLLGIQTGSPTDWLLWIAIFLPQLYFFVFRFGYKHAKAQGGWSNG